MADPRDADDRRRSDDQSPDSDAAIPFHEDTDGDGMREAWDAHDERRQKDQFAPPMEPCECYCLHCHRTYMSDGMWLQRIINDPRGDDGMDGFWMCPTNNCGGAGFTMDIFPTDPDHPANAGWVTTDEYDEDDFDGDGNFIGEDEDTEEDDDEGEAAPRGDGDNFEVVGNPAEMAIGDGADGTEDRLLPKEWTPESDADDLSDIIEGDEWKLGVAPGEPVPEQTYWSEKARIEWDVEQKRFDEPDERPRVVDYSELKSSHDFPMSDDDIPF